MPILPATDPFREIGSPENSAAGALVGQLGMPVGIPSSGTIGANGALSGLTAMPFTSFPQGCYFYFPAGAVYANSPAGLYYTLMGSTTTGTVFRDTYTGGNPKIPDSPAGVIDAGPGVYVQSTALSVVVFSYTLPANALGEYGNLFVQWFNEHTNSANNKFMLGSFGGTSVIASTMTTSVYQVGARLISNFGSKSRQVCASAGVITYTTSNAAATRPVIDTSVDQLLTLSLNISNASEFAFMSTVSLTLFPGVSL